MAIATNINDLEKAKFKESTTTSGQAGVVVVNPDGSSIGSAASGTGTSANQIQGNLAAGGTESSSYLPVGIGGLVVDVTALPTIVAAGNRVKAAYNGYGALYTSDMSLSAGEFLSEGTNGVLGTVKVPVSTSTFAKSYDISTAAEASSVVKASAGNLYDVHATNSSGSARYFQLFKSATVPADTTVPNISIYVAAGGSIHETWPEGKYSSVGWAWAWSSTAATKTIGGSDGIAEVEYL